VTLARATEISEFRVFSAGALRRIMAFEASHTPGLTLDSAMVLLKTIFRWAPVRWRTVLPSTAPIALG
jgi:hypothetical protein